MCQFVAWVVHNVPRDAVVKPNQNTCKTGRSSSGNGNVALAAEVKQVHEPRTLAPRFLELKTLFWPVAAAVGCTTSEGWFKLGRNVELFKLNITKGKLGNASEGNDQNGNGEIADRSSNHIIAEEGQMMEQAESDSKEGTSKSQDKTE